MIKKLSLLSLVSLSLMASNGTNLIGTSTVSRSMGGTGVAFYSHATEALGKNVSLMGDIKDKDEFQFDMTYFRANVTSTTYDKMPLNANLNGNNLPSYDAPTTAKSQNMIDTNFIPSVSYATRIDDKTVFGFAMIGSAGMADNYKGNYAQRQLKSSMMLMKLIPAISYRQGNTTFGFAPVLGLGSMSLNYDDTYLDKNGNLYPTGTKPQSDRKGLLGTNVGGDSLVPALGFTAGMDVKVTKKFRIGMSYNSALKYTYKNVANFSQFGPQGMVYMADEWMRNNTSNHTGLDASKGISQNLQNAGMNKLPADAIEALAGTTTIQGALSATDPKKLDNLTLEQPWEIAVGFAYDITDITSFTFDYRFVAWQLAEGYKDFGWENQNVLAFGMQFQAKKNLQIRAGYNYANSPLSSTSGEQGALLTDVQGHLIFDQALSMLNMVGFPAISTTHFSAGFGYQYSEFMTFDFAAVYAPQVKTSKKGSLSPLQTGFDALDMSYEYATTMEQYSLSFGINYKF
jgi:long-chain fatty acid transport protein